MLTWAVSSMIAAQLLVRWGFRKVALVGACLIATGFAGLLLCAIFSAPHWMLTTVLAITGFGFGPASMSCLLAAQDSVTWQQRGVVTSGITFCRTMGGAMGIGLLGAMFNWLIGPQLAQLKAQGATPAAVLDPSVHHVLAPDLLQAVQQMISGGLLWVFGAMLLLALLQIVISARMSGRKAEHKVSGSEAMEAMAG
jgi:MFS family permease